jgi:hypothetical protein
LVGSETTKVSNPLVNYTAIVNEIKHDPNFDDAFPRWLATTKLVNPDKSV